MEPAFGTITFLSDFGRSDEFVGVVHSVIRSIAPGVAVIDLTHDVPPHDVRAGGLVLARSVQYLAPGIVLGIVDPGVGTARKPAAIEVGDGQAYLIGPDNGLFAAAVSMVGGATAAYVLDRTDHHLPAAGATFAGRDVFAPVAAHLASGVPITELGSPIDPASLLPGVLPVSQLEDDGSIKAEVLWVDRFGNCQLNVDPSEVADWGPDITIEGGRLTRTALRVDAYGEIPAGGIGLVVDSYGLLSISVDRGSAALELELADADSLTLRRAEGRPSTPVAVRLGAKPTTERPEEQG